MTLYEKQVIERGKARRLIGLVHKYLLNIKFGYYRHLVRVRGGKIGNTSIISYQLAKHANANLVVGEHCNIQAEDIDTRASVKIGDYVIIGHNVSISTNSHNIDSPEWENKSYGITISDYVWIAPYAHILPSCRHIGYGAVIGAAAVIHKNADEMSIYSGNPGTVIRKRQYVHKNLCVEWLHGGDYRYYRDTISKYSG